MGKAEQKETRTAARGIGATSKADTDKALHGGGAFGDTGLTGERAQAQVRRDDTLGDVNDWTSRAKTYSDTGGVDPGQLEKIRSGYEGFATTGGFNPGDEAVFRRNATSSVPATYEVLKNEVNRKRSLLGGLGPGGELSQMARQEGEVSARANTAAEAALAEQKRTGRLAGISGLGQTEQQLASNKLAGLQTGAGISQNLYNSQTGEISDMGRQVLSMLGIDSSNQAESVNVLQSLANTPGVFDNIMRIGGLAAGALGSVAGSRGLLGR